MIFWNTGVLPLQPLYEPTIAVIATQVLKSAAQPSCFPCWSLCLRSLGLQMEAPLPFIVGTVAK
ncbi:hypothetical protein [Noviherbaspirillum aerium]|uniref:hypothetical protein n=1 Tax=Noviherbaspirillum aerium TaxID=2588497 RepID=UPI00124CFD43|nr:hypothetical protein [Noviherbaspirillum aerium]